MSTEYILEKLVALEKRIQDLETFSPKPIIAIANRGSNQTINNTTITMVNFDTTERDTRAAVTTSPNWRFNVPVGGDYWIASHIVLGDLSASWAVGETAKLMVYKNGTEYKTLAKSNNTASGGTPLLRGGVLVPVAEGDYLEIAVYHDSGVAQNVLGSATQSWVTIHKTRSY